MKLEIRERIKNTKSFRVPEGYKKTKCGVIPTEWDIKKLSELAEISSGGTPSRNVENYWNGNVPWVTTSLIAFNEITCVDEYITEIGLSNSAAKLYPPLTILMAMYGQGVTRGKVGILKITAATNQACCAIQVKNENVKFVYYFLEHNYESIRKLSMDGNQKNLSGSIIKDIMIPLTKIKEQQKIATILSTWDEAIELKEHLIEEKKLQKKSLMKKLLTGEVRLPGFDGEWKEFELGKISDMNSGGTPKSTMPKYYDGDIPWVSISDMTKKGKYIDSTERKISNLGLNSSSAVLYPVGTVLYAMYASIGLCSISEVELTSSQAILGIRPKINLNNEYLYYYLTSLKEKLKLQGQTGTQSNLNAGMVKKIIIKLPELNEQEGIVAILLECDKSIKLYQQELSALKLQKKGLMQLLLTGIVRVQC
ncbi:MAG: restriction endonuclease subunit S [Peptostreptococcaceae bacterium]|nr:restriction endonuclease subunit S [Peptostreptococcaceae bacterium]